MEAVKTRPCALTATRRSLRELPLLWCVEAGPGHCPLILKCVQSHRLACARHASVATANSLAAPVDANTEAVKTRPCTDRYNLLALIHIL